MKEKYRMGYFKREQGFTLIEVLVVIIIIAGLAAIAIPKLVSTTANARQKADVATAHQVKAALDRYQIEKGIYPKGLAAKDGVVTAAGFIPNYISKLDKETTQQISEGKEGFGLATLEKDGSDKTAYVIPEDAEKSNLIMIYLSDDGLAAEVQAFNEDQSKVLWTSAN